MNINISQMIGGKEGDEEIISESSFRIRCCIPCIVQSYNATNNTVECQPAIREVIVDENGNEKYVNLPLLINVPVVFPNTGKYGIKFPLQQGDEVLVFFSDLSIDNFWEKGNVQNPIEQRRHDLSDGMAIPCALSLPKQSVNLVTGITFSGSDITFKTQNIEIGISSLVNRISTLENNLVSLTNRVQTAENNIVTLTNNLNTLTNTFNAHKHTVTVGDDTYQTSTPI